jgi:hypothetical protein
VRLEVKDYIRYVVMELREGLMWVGCGSNRGGEVQGAATAVSEGDHATKTDVGVEDTAILTPVPI